MVSSRWVGCRGSINIEDRGANVRNKRKKSQLTYEQENVVLRMDLLYAVFRVRTSFFGYRTVLDMYELPSQT